MDHSEKVRRMLKGLAPADFVNLPDEDRNTVYRRYLTQEQNVMIEEGDEEDFFNPKIADGVLLRQQYRVGNDEAGKQIVQEARKTYYQENTFTIRSHWLGEFMIDTLADGTRFHVAPLIRSILVTVDLENIWGDELVDDDDDIGVSGESQQEYMRRVMEKRNKKPAPRRRAAPKVMRTIQQLRQLLSFKNAEWIGIEIRGRGALDGSDLKTQIKIKEISGIVKQLVQTFGTRFTISKVAVDQEGYSRNVYHNLRPYWDSPTSEDRASVRRGDPTIQALMRVQIDDWTYKAPEISTAASMTRERLL
jgi:hypothetical protein